MRIHFYVIALFLLSSCDTTPKRKTYKNNVPILKKLLVGGWVADSIDGSKQFVQDWVYFSPDNKFWRLSNYNESYIIDSSLEYKNDNVLKNGALLYSIYSVDANHLLLVTAHDTVLHLRRRGGFDAARINRMVEANPKKQLINGKWRLDSSTYLGAYMPSYCNNLYPGSRFEFHKDGVLDIYPKDSSHKCSSYTYKVYGEELGLMEFDMVFDLPIVKLTKDSLVLQSSWVDYKDGQWTEEKSKAREKGYHLYLTKIRE